MTKIRLHELAKLLKKQLPYANLTPISRNCGRRKDVVLKWYENNWNKIVKVLNNIIIYDDTANPVLVQDAVR